ncbi:Transient receptor potential cation channel subfamily A member 1 [Chionoecetes opilio]|uniref:Transient receptor potential cation channel subfamily A member 1 n=1 Tax=Chionoecetes opilio TaxID=41210 RepID=A0A8J5CV15_CHIOP|nr:Transient receptor potential cation channel subfamily A member 1 [Chionoecetes opilio]
MVGCEQLSLLQHPLVEAWLNYKWCSYARLLFLLLLLLRLFAVAALISFLLYTMNWTQIKKKYNLTEEEICGGVSLKDGCMQEPLTPWPCPGALPALLVHLLLAFSLLLQVVTELVALMKTGKRHMEETFFMRLPSMCLTLAALLPTSTCELTSGIKSVYAWECGILALLLTWLDLIYNINRLPQFTMFSGINVKFFKGYVKGLLYLAMMVFVFSFAFHLLLGDQVSFHSVPLSMVQVVVWMIGDLNYNDNFLNARLDYPLLSISLFLLFVCTVGAFFITLLKTPSTNKKQLRYYKQTGRIYLLLKIDIRFPWVRNLGLTYEFNDRQPIPSMFVKIMKHMVYGEDPRKETRPLRNFPKRQDQTDTAIPPARNSIYCGAEKLMAYFENMANFIQMDDMDDEEDKDDGGAVKKVLEEHGKKLDELMSRFDQYKLHCEERLNLLDLKQRPGKPKTISNQQYNIQT